MLIQIGKWSVQIPDFLFTRTIATITMTTTVMRNTHGIVLMIRTGMLVAAYTQLRHENWSQCEHESCYNNRNYQQIDCSHMSWSKLLSSCLTIICWIWRSGGSRRKIFHWTQTCNAYYVSKYNVMSKFIKSRKQYLCYVTHVHFYA